MSAVPRPTASSKAVRSMKLVSAQLVQCLFFSTFVEEFLDEPYGKKISAGFNQNFIFRTQHILFHRGRIIITHEVTRRSRHYSVTKL